MKNKISIYLGFALFFSFLAIVLYSCKKDKVVTPNQELSLFGAGGTTTSYLVPEDPNASFKIGLGITKPAPVDRQITFSVTSPTGAEEGTHYTISSKSVTIPAGKVVDSVALKGIFANYPTGRRDTLVFTITGGDVPAMNGSNTYKVVLQKFCPLDMSEFEGDFEVLDDDWQDFFAGDIVPLTVDGDTIIFYYPTSCDIQPLKIVVNPETFVTSLAQTAFGRYTCPSGTNYTAKSAVSASNVVIPCDKIVSVMINFGTTGGSNYGNFLLRLRKI